MQYDLIINVDGTCMGSSRFAGAGGIIKNSLGKDLHKFSIPVDDPANHAAYYLAIIRALEYIINNKIEAKIILVETDSHVIVTQAVGRNKILPDNLKDLVEIINGLKEKLNCNIDFLWIPEEDNFKAKALAYKSANMPIALIVDDDIIPWKEDLLHCASQEELDGLPVVNMQTCEQIICLNSSKHVKPWELISLLTYGMDKYSRAKTQDLLKFITIRFGCNTCEYLVKMLGDLDCSYSKNALRWISRGLRPDIAFRKAAIELEIKEII